MTNTSNEMVLCKYLLQKYADLINEREQRTIGEIKELVNGSDLSIQSIIDDFKENDYSFQDNYESALVKAFDFAKREINFVDIDLNLNYWLSSKEIIELRVADDEDFAVFMCNIMKALGDERAEVIIAELENLKTHAFVATQIGTNYLILDPAQNHAFEKYKGNRTDVIKNYSFNSNKIRRFLYRFNSEKYEQFLEENED